MKNRYWLLCFAIVIAACLGWWLIVASDSGSSVGIYQDGELLYELDLSEVTEPYELTVEYNGSKNVILVEQDSISVIEADCADHVCVDHGALGDKTPIVCLPNRLVIDWIDEKEELDAVI